MGCLSFMRCPDYVLRFGDGYTRYACFVGLSRKKRKLGRWNGGQEEKRVVCKSATRGFRNEGHEQQRACVDVVWADGKRQDAEKRHKFQGWEVRRKGRKGQGPKEWAWGWTECVSEGGWEREPRDNLTPPCTSPRTSHSTSSRLPT